MKHIVRFFSAPLIVIGFVYQFIAGGIMAGRMLATQWIRGIALKELAKVVESNLADKPAAPKNVKGLH